MVISLGRLLVLFADAPAAEGASPGALPWLWLPAIMLLFYMMFFRPQRREATQRAAMLQALKPNDHIVTAGGIYGVVTNVHREAGAVTIRVDENNNTRLKVSLSAVSRVIGDEPSGDATAK